MTNKNTLVYILALLFSISSCVTTKQFHQDFHKAALEGREPDKEAIIITKSGEKFEGKELTYSKFNKMRAKQIENWVAIDGKKINKAEIAVIQNKYSYTAFFQRPDLPKGEIITVDRIRFGKINLYCYAHEPLGVNQDDVRGLFHVYVFEKEFGKLVQLNFWNFSEAIKDNPAALKKLKELFPKSEVPRFKEKMNLEGLTAVTELYNN